METMDFETLSGYFIRGDISGAIEYMSRFDELRETADAYINLYEKEQYLRYGIPEPLEGVLLEYQKYFREVFYLKSDKNEADARLLSRLAKRLGTAEDESTISDSLKTLFAENGFHIQTGRTQGFYGPYVWRETALTEYDVELPCGVRKYKVNILRGFVMCGYMNYLTFGQFGTRGWAGEDEMINCVESANDFAGEQFTVSLLKHEAQHVEDKETWQDITPMELEYRAKLVELMYAEKEDLLGKFVSEASKDDPENSHAMASARIADEMRDLCGSPTSEIRKRAKELFYMSTERLNDTVR